MPRISRRALRILFGSSLLVLGVAGLALPVLQGWFFILMGILVLAKDVPLFDRLASKIKKRFSAASRR
jgi:uncharacterized membrane protein YbaN (DUF454 family)